MKARRTKLRHLAGGLIAASVGTGLLTRTILVSAFALWGIVQIGPGLPDNALLNDVVIGLFVVDLAILVSPWMRDSQHEPCA